MGMKMAGGEKDIPRRLYLLVIKNWKVGDLACARYDRCDGII